jgi:hypothetical protein
MTLLKDIEHAAEGSVSWLIAAAHALEERLIAIETLIEQAKAGRPEPPAPKAPEPPAPKAPEPPAPKAPEPPAPKAPEPPAPKAP